MFKRITVSLAALLLIISFLSALSACGGDADGVTDNTAEAAEAQAVTETETATEPPEYTPPESDWGGAEITVAAENYGKGNNWIALDYCEMFSEEENGDPLNDAIYKRMRAVEEELNLKISLYGIDRSTDIAKELTKTVSAGEDIIDFGMATTVYLPAILNKKLLIDLKTLPDIDFSHSWWDRNSIAELEILGKLCAVTGDISLYNDYAVITYFFNKRLHESLGLDNLYDLVRSGKWTLDEAMAMCEAAAADLNGNGEPDIEDRFGMLFESNSLRYTAFSCGVRFTKIDSEGVPQLCVNQDLASRVADAFVPFMKDKRVNILANNYTGYNNTFTDLMLPMFQDNRALFYNNQMLVALNLRNMEADFGIVPPPKLEEAQSGYHCPINDSWTTLVVVPVTNTIPEMTGQVIEAMGFYGQQLVKPAFIDTTVRSKALRDEDSSEMMELIFKSRIYDPATFFDFGGINGLFDTVLNRGEGSFASSYAKIETKVQKDIDKTVQELAEG
ncbi:MAG: hypothetical protein GX827_09905 [Clostridiales bacterium]|nr:hypothetical protein [Clostridiales bacterium]